MYFNNKLLDLSVVIPAYQEEENLRVLLPRILDEIKKLKVNSEVLVVDTQKPLDNTEKFCKEIGIKVIRRKIGDCYGDAIRTGIDNAKGKYLIFMDGDGSHSPEFISDLFLNKENQDIVIASRYIKGGFSENNIALIYMSQLLNFSYSVILGINCKDVSNSYRLYRSEQIKSINLTCNNFDIVEEILLQLSFKYKPLRILEIPCTFKQRLFGKSKRNLIIFIITYIFTLLKLKFKAK